MPDFVQEYDIKLKKDETGDWWFMANDADAIDAIKEILKQRKETILRKGAKRVQSGRL